MNLLLLPAAVLVAALLTHGVLRWFVPWLERRAVFDLPNARSMHARPVVRGGGAAFAAVVLLAHAALLVGGALPAATWVWWLAAAAFALLGWWDDRYGLPAGRRLLLQFVIGTAFVLTLPPPALTVAWHASPLYGAGLALGVIVALVWMVNLYNFMDGADAYAATAAICIALPVAALLLLDSAPAGAFVALVVAGACAGFLRWNWPPARVFMGDVGSYFLGAEFAALALYGNHLGLSPWLWLIIVAPFVTDASLTLCHRALRGEPLARAHREHAYQRLLLAGWPVPRLLCALIGVHLGLCWPLATLAYRGLLPGPAAALVVYGLTAIMWARISLAHSQAR